MQRFDDSADAALLPAKVGVDFGAHETRFALPSRPLLEDDGTVESEKDGEPRLLTLPTLMSYSREGAVPVQFSCVGHKALSRRDHMRLVHPYRTSLDRRGKVLGDFASHLRELIQKKHEPAPWAVVNCSVGAAPEEMAAKRTLANELFERVVYADDTFLLAVGLASQEVCKHSILIDIGATSIRGALMHGETPSPEERVEVPFGGEKVDEALRKSLSIRYPELLLTPRTLTEIKESLAFVAPERRACELRIQFRGKERAVDVTEILHDASSALVPPLLRAARDVLALCPSDEIEAFQRNIVLSGGGAELPGIVPRVEEELRADGFELARVRQVSGSRFLVARGALRWAHLLRDDQWSIPLFSFAG
jgi:hypothetical protein